MWFGAFLCALVDLSPSWFDLVDSLNYGVFPGFWFLVLRLTYLVVCENV